MDLPGYIKEFLQTNYYVSDADLAVSFDEMKPYIRDLITSKCLDLKSKDAPDAEKQVFKTEDQILEEVKKQYKADIDSDITGSREAHVDNFVKHQKTLNGLADVARKQTKNPDDFDEVSILMAAKRMASDEYVGTPKTLSNFMKVQKEVKTELYVKFWTSRYYNENPPTSETIDKYPEKTLEDINTIAQMVQTGQQDKIASRFNLPDTQEKRDESKAGTLSFAMAELKNFSNDVEARVKNSAFGKKVAALDTAFQKKYPKTYVAAKVAANIGAAFALGPIFSAYRAAAGINGMRKDFAKIKAENPDEKASFWKYLRSKDGRQKMLMTGQNTLRMIPGARAVGIALSAVRNSDGLRNSIKELKDGGNSKKAWMKVGIAAAGLLAISVTAACLNDEIAEHVGDFVSNTLGSAKDTIHDTIANVSSHLGIGSANAEELAAAGNSGAAAGAVGIADAQETLTVLHGNPALLDKAARFLDDKTISGLSSQIESGAIPLPEGMTAEDFIYKTSMLKAYAPYAEKETLSMLTAAAAGKSLSAEELTSINESVGRVQASGHYLGNFTKDFSSLSEKEAQSLFNQLAHSKNPQEAYDQMKALHTENPSAFAQVKNEYLPKGSVSASAASHTAETVTNNGSAGAAASTVIANANGSNTVVFGENSSSQVTYRFVQTENGLRLSASGQLSTGNLNEHDAQAYHEALRNNPRMGSLGAQQAVINMKVAESIKEQYQANPSPELEAQYNVAAGQAARYGVKMTNVSESSTSFKTGVVADHTKTTDMVHAPVYVGDANNSNNNLINEQNLNKNFEQNRPNALVMKDEQPFDKTKPNALEMKNETPFDKTKPNALEVKEGQAVQNTTSANNGLLKNGSKISDAQISGYGVDTESGTGFVGITDGTTSNGVYVNRTAHGTSTTVTVNDNSNVRVSVGDDGKVGGKVNINRDADPTKDGVTVTNVSCNTDENSAKVTTTHNKTGIKTTVQKSGDTYSVGAEKGPGRSVTVSMDKKGEISVKAGGSNLPVKKIVDIFKGLKR